MQVIYVQLYSYTAVVTTPNVYWVYLTTTLLLRMLYILLCSAVYLEIMLIGRRQHLCPLYTAYS